MMGDRLRTFSYHPFGLTLATSRFEGECVVKEIDAKFTGLSNQKPGYLHGPESSYDLLLMPLGIDSNKARENASKNQGAVRIYSKQDNALLVMSIDAYFTLCAAYEFDPMRSVVNTPQSDTAECWQAIKATEPSWRNRFSAAAEKQLQPARQAAMG